MDVERKNKALSEILHFLAQNISDIEEYVIDAPQLEMDETAFAELQAAMQTIAKLKAFVLWKTMEAIHGNSKQ